MAHVTRGFTTAQLLHLAGIATANYIYLHPDLRPTKMEKPKGSPPGTAKVKKFVKLTASNDVYDTLARTFGLPKPAKGGIKGVSMLSKLASAKGTTRWFNNGAGSFETGGPFAPISAEGQQIQQRRALILEWLNRPMQDADPNMNGKRMIDYVLNPQAYEPTSRPGAKGQAQIKGEDAGTKLKKALTSSFLWHAPGQPAPPQGTKFSLQQVIQAVGMVWQATLSNPAEPLPVKKVGGGGIGQPRAASIQQAQQEITRSSGFVSAKVLKYLASRYEDPNRYVTKTARHEADTPQQLAARREFVAAFRAAFNLPADMKYTEARARLIGAKMNAGQIADAFRTIAASLGGADAAREKLWIIGTEGKVSELLAGNDILTPGTGTTRGWIWSPNAQPAADPSNQLGFTRYVYDQLFNKFGLNTSGRDNLSTRAQTRAATLAAGGGVKPKGILGTDDKSFADLSKANPEQVAKFIKKARTGQFSMNALQEGARRLEIPVDANAVMHEAVIGLLVDGVVRMYGPQVDAGSPAHVLAVGAAVGIQSAAQMSPAAIRRKIDAKYGLITDACAGPQGRRNYTTDDLKRIAKGLGISVTDKSDHDGLCSAITAALQSQNRGPDQATAVTSGARSNREHATARVSSGRGRGGAARTAGLTSGPFAAMVAGVQQQQASNLAAFAATALPQPTAGFGPAQPFGSPTVSPRSRLARLGQAPTVLTDQFGNVVQGTQGAVAGQPAPAGMTVLPTAGQQFQMPQGFAQQGGQGAFLSPGQTRQFSPTRGVVPFQAATAGGFAPTAGTGGFL